MTRHLIVGVVVAFALCISAPVLADPCSCTYGGARPCSAAISCPGSEKATCVCNHKGCSASCGAAGPNQLDDVFTVMQACEMSLDGFRSHLDQKQSGWAVGTKTTIGLPLTLETLTKTYENLTLAELANAIADDLDLCVEIDDIEKTIAYKVAGTCS